MAGAGYLPTQIDDMGFHDVLALLKYWSQFPPPAEAIRRIGEGLGIEKPLDKQQPALPPASADDPAGIGGLIAQFPSGFVPVNR